MRLAHVAFLILFLVKPGVAPLLATYSIIASEPMTGQCGVAVQTDNLAVGASVPYAQAGVGAIASQFETNPLHGPRGLALLSQGKNPAEVLQELLREDGNFEGRGIEARQVAIVSADGRTAIHTGTDAAQAAWAGFRSGRGYSVQGNGLAGPQVVEAMERAFLNTGGSLADRLLAALSAGDKAGGQKTGRESAALLVRTREGFPLDTDLRVDHAEDPVGQLRELYGLQSARQQIIQARIVGNSGKIDEARALLLVAAPRVAAWPRAGVLAAEVAVEVEEPDLAIECLARAFEQNPARIPSVLGDGTFELLGADPRFHRWVSAKLEQQVLAENETSTTATEMIQLTMARRLLEVGQASQALAVLQISLPQAKSAAYFLLLATAHVALGALPAAIADCEVGLKNHSGDGRLRLRLARLRSPSNSFR